MSKTPKKWTKWIPHTGDEIPVACGEEIKFKRYTGFTHVTRAAALNWECEGGITHYKRLRANVEGEMARDDIESARHDAQDAIYISNDGVVRSASTQEPISGRTSKFSRKFDKAPPETTAVISGPGDYETMSGARVTIDRSIKVWREDEICMGKGWTSEGIDVTPGNCERVDIKGPWNEERSWDEAKNPEPTPIITGPGEYKTRGEEKVTISGKGRAFGWLGYFQSSTNLTTWHDDGAYVCASFPSHDIIGPWEEPEAEHDKSHIAAVLADQVCKGTATPEQEAQLRDYLAKPEPEMWVNVYENGIGANYASGIYNKKPASNFSHSHRCIGTFKLVKDTTQ